MKDLREYILSLRSKRVWWKPWTWIRRSPLVAYWPLTTEGKAVNAAIVLERQKQLLELCPSPTPPHDWDGQQWLVTGISVHGDELSRTIYVNYVTPESLAKLGFDINAPTVTIRPINQMERR